MVNRVEPGRGYSRMVLATLVQPKPGSPQMEEVVSRTTVLEGRS